MVDFLSIKSVFLYNLKIHNFKIFFGLSFNIQKTDYNLFNKDIIYKVNQ